MSTIHIAGRDPTEPSSEEDEREGKQISKDLCYRTANKKEKYMESTVKYRGGSVMLWAFSSRITELHRTK